MDNLSTSPTKDQPIEWPTLLLILGCYGFWLMATTILAQWSLPLAIILCTLTLTFHSSLQHEIIHGHPFKNQSINEALVWLPIGLAIPFERFRDTHLAHHKDANLTDPYDDPETGYLDPEIWNQLSHGFQKLLMFNNTLLGRMVIGPLLGQVSFMRDELRLARNQSSSVSRAWIAHAFGFALVITWLWLIGSIPIWAYLISAYAALSILKIRTFLEHRAHTHMPSRTVIIEDRGPLAFLFLNNNLHLVHHAHPSVPWYKLPRLYRSRAAEYQKRNQGYCYRSYAEIFRAYFVKRKEPVAHPFYRK